jgi:hypothetical protein
MAKLVIKLEGLENRVLDLRLGVNRFGRSLANDFVIEHPTISAHHCEIILEDGALILRDKNSTNGTFINSQPVTEARLATGQTLRLGDVELLVEAAEVAVAIPKFDMPMAVAPPVMLPDGGVLCPRHDNSQVTHQCTFCMEVMCDACVHRLRRRGGRVLKLCPICSNKVEPLGGRQRKKKSFFGFLLHKTVKLPFLRRSHPDSDA